MSGIIPPHVLGHLVSAADPSCAVHAANSRENYDSGSGEASRCKRQIGAWLAMSAAHVSWLPRSTQGIPRVRMDGARLPLALLVVPTGSRLYLTVEKRPAQAGSNLPRASLSRLGIRAGRFHLRRAAMSPNRLGPFTSAQDPSALPLAR